ncbi:hypothetical protein B0I37DRAFT_357208 [Chaetomium sp. MPI-CAGE-AT-0009]|nr:hypothetical protein B0I37DRAFT_357208 [Chaetomium sp. MPI-CAGE-AT-0009]
MQLPNLSVLTLASILALGGTVSAGTRCSHGEGAFHQRYVVIASGVGASEIPAVCGGLWDNLKRFGSCTASGTFCGRDGDHGVDDLEWAFNVPHGCNPGMVHSAWWEATQNKWGSISCP